MEWGRDSMVSSGPVQVVEFGRIDGFYSGCEWLDLPGDS